MKRNGIRLQRASGVGSNGFDAEAVSDVSSCGWRRATCAQWVGIGAEASLVRGTAHSRDRQAWD